MIAWPARCPASRHESLRRVRGDPTRLRGRRCAVGCHRDARARPKRPVSRRGGGGGAHPRAPQREQPSGAPLSHSPVRERARLLRGTSSPATRAPRSYKRYCAAHALVSAPESLKTLIHARSDPHLTHRWVGPSSLACFVGAPRPQARAHGARGAPSRRARARLAAWWAGAQRGGAHGWHGRSGGQLAASVGASCWLAGGSLARQSARGGARRAAAAPRSHTDLLPGDTPPPAHARLGA